MHTLPTRRMLMLLALSLISLFGFAQNRTISGTITDIKTGAPIYGASVVVKGTTNGTTSQEDGSFTISVPPAASTLVISSVGYDSQELTIGSGAMKILLVPTTSSLNEVVVIAYGTQKKGDLTGAVTSISAKDFQKGNINSPEQLLQGKVAGLQVTTGGGSAGGGSRIRIRGGASLNASNDPLIVVDGVPVESNGIAGSANYLNTINPTDIESMSVLKDASATALYGSRASNGVIIITTKKGNGGKFHLNYNTQLSLSGINNYVDVLNGDQLREIINNDAAKTGNNTYKNVLGTENTNWQKQIYRQGVGYDNTLSMTGGLGKLPYRLSLGYLTQDGILKTNDFKRLSSALNLSPKFFDNHLLVNVSVKASQTNNRFANEGAIGAAVSFDPTQPVYSGGKNWGGYYEWLQANGNPIDLATRNPLALLELRDNTSQVRRIIGNVQLDYKLHFFPDLHVLLNLGIDNASGQGEDNTDSTSATNYKTNGRFVHYEQKKRNTLTDLSLKYEKELTGLNSKIDLLVGHSYQDFYTLVSNFAAYGQDGVLIPGSEPTFENDKPEYRLESYLARANINIADKYLITASMRRDASSKFSPATRVGYFPAIALAWKLKEEFFPDNKVINELKIRFGLGSTGQQDGIGYYSYLPRYSLSNSTAQYQFGNAYYNYLRPEGYDPNLKWESTTTTNVGLDYELFAGRIAGSVEYYYKKTKDLLAEVTVAPGANFVNKLTTNVGNVENKGVEFTINTIPVDHGDLRWNLGFNYTYNQSKITNLLKYDDAGFTGFDVSGIGGGTGNTIGKHYVGYAPYTFFPYKQVYDPNTGKPIEGLYEDINRDGIVNEADRYFYKKPAADVFVGFNTQVNYKQFSLGLAAHGSFGNYLYNNYRSGAGVLRAIENPINFIGNASVNYLETGFVNNRYTSDYYIENASFFRLDNVNLGYNAGRVFKDAASLRVSLTFQNLFIITNYSGLDPEVASDSGVDGNIYPRPRMATLGLNFEF